MEMETYARMIANNLDEALKMVEDTQKDDLERGELITPDRFSRGYALGYAHALTGAYNALPSWLHDKI